MNTDTQVPSNVVFSQSRTNLCLGLLIAIMVVLGLLALFALTGTIQLCSIGTPGKWSVEEKREETQNEALMDGIVRSSCMHPLLCLYITGWVSLPRSFNLISLL